MPMPPTSRRPALLLIVLVWDLTACASQPLPPPQPVQPPQIPPPPAELMQPPASGLWSDSVLQLFRKWQQLLTPQTPV